MGTKAFEIFVTFSALDHLSAPMRRMATEMGLLNNQSEALQRKLTGFRNMGFVGAGITAMGVAMGAGLMYAAGKASELQTALTQLSALHKMTAAQFEKAGNLAQNITAPTGLSQIQGVQIMQGMLQGGLTFEQVQDQKTLQQFTNVGELRNKLHHEDLVEAVTGIAGMANMWGVQGKDLPKFMDRLNAAIQQSGYSTHEFATQFGYAATSAKIMKVRTDDFLDTVVWMKRMGVPRGGGTGFSQFLLRGVYGTGKKHDAAMQALGLVQNGKSILEGKDLSQDITIMQAVKAGFHGTAGQLANYLKDIFGVNGMKIAGAMTSDTAMSQYRKTEEAIRTTPTINETQGIQNMTPQGQFNQLTSNVEDIVTNFGKQLLPALMGVLVPLNEIVSAIKDWTQENPEMLKSVAMFAEIATAAALIVGPFLIFAGAVGYLATSGIVTAGIGMIGTALLSAIPLLGTLGLALVTLYTAWTRNWGGMRTTTMKFFADLKTYWLNDTNYAGLKFEETRDKFNATHKKQLADFIAIDNNMTTEWKAWCKATVDSFTEASHNIAASFNFISTQWHWLLNDMQPGADFITKWIPLWKIPGVAGAAADDHPYAHDYETWGDRAKLHQIYGPQYLKDAEPGHGHDNPGRPDLQGMHTTHFHEGAIVINQLPGQNGRHLARQFYSEIGVIARNISYASPESIRMGTT